MRHVIGGLGLAVLVLTGCNNWLHRPATDTLVSRTNQKPTAEQLVRYLNANADRVQSLECRQVFLDAKQGNQAVGLDALIACQKPRDFRMVGRVAGSPEVDLGSNGDEFWYWIRRAEPAYLYHCSYQDFSRGVRMPFPFQPEWIIEALGIAHYDENKKYEVVETQNTYELVERTTSPQGQPVRKVTIFRRGQSGSGGPQLIAHALQDGQGREICSARILETQYDQASGAVLPKRVHLAWPQEKIEMKMKLDGVSVGQIEPQRASGLFSRANLTSVPGYDLARGPDAGTVQRAGGPVR
jgi:hypothetical protein